MLPRSVLLLLPMVAFYAGCSSGGIDPRTLPTLAASGIYASDAAVGQLGTLRLHLEQREDSRVFDATLSFPDSPALGTSDGFGTLADGHLILDFDNGAKTEYFLEGNVTMDGAVPDAINGQLVFPDQNETLPVTFSYVSALPPGA